MKKFKLFLILAFVYGCQGSSDRSSTYERILDYSNQIMVINTHEHQHTPAECRTLYRPEGFGWKMEK